jgi:hypothetical protein
MQPLQDGSCAESSSTCSHQQVRDEFGLTTAVVVSAAARW